MKILVTGVAGHVGSRLADWMVRNHPEVQIIGIDDLSWGYEENVPNEVEFHNLSLGHPDTLSHLSRFDDVDYVLHFAAYPAEGRSPFIRCYNYRNNIMATAQIVNFCINQGIKRLVYTSSMAVYGKESVPYYEHQPCHPIDPYGVAKLACEQDIRIAGTQHDLDWCIIRPHNIIGPYQCIWQDYRNVFGIWMRQYLESKPLRIYGDGKQRRAFSPINDCLPCFWRAATNKHASHTVSNLGGDHHITIKDACQILLTQVIKDPDYPVEHVEPRHEVKDAWCTSENSEIYLGYQQNTTLLRCLRDMWAWSKDAWLQYPERRDREDSAEFEIEKGLYSFWRK